MEFVIDVAFVLGAVSFVKHQFGLQGWGALALAFVLSVCLAFVPELLAAFPAAAPSLEKLFRIGELFLTAPGLFNLAKELS